MSIIYFANFSHHIHLWLLVVFSMRIGLHYLTCTYMYYIYHCVDNYSNAKADSLVYYLCSWSGPISYMLVYSHHSFKTVYKNFKHRRTEFIFCIITIFLSPNKNWFTAVKRLTIIWLGVNYCLAREVKCTCMWIRRVYIIHHSSCG